MCAPTWTSSQLFTVMRFDKLNLDFEFEILMQITLGKKKSSTKDLLQSLKNAES